MKHAGRDALDQLEDLLSALRRLPDLRERSRGVFYRRSTSFLHFHDDPAGLFADLRRGGEFKRFKVSSAAERRAFIAVVRSELEA
ncbi:MAG: hypothetical protein FWD12_05725 [Alphaproteobacteria bacterium]|nr:hypothetical protein [Alphaproteobacteria bacterium]